MPTSSDTRPPSSRRWKRSRPRSSVPSQCSADGGSKRRKRSVAVRIDAAQVGDQRRGERQRRAGRPGTTSDACARRWRISAAHRPAGARAGGVVMRCPRSTRADRPRHRRGRPEDCRAMVASGRDQQADQREIVVVVEDRLVDRLAHARPGEHGLGDQRAREQAAERERQDRQHRRQRVGEGVAPQHAALGRALGAGGADIVLAQRLDHRAAHEARVGAELDQGRASATGRAR